MTSDEHIIKACVLDSDVFKTSLEVGISAADFKDKRLSHIFEAMEGLQVLGLDIDAASVTGVIIKKGVDGVLLRLTELLK